jgi:ribosomal protein S18 acetylase RimI-like enzyme
MVKKASVEDIAGAARVHMAAFPDSFSTKLGFPYVKKAIGWYLSTPKAFLLVALDEKQYIGYCGCFIADGQSAAGSTSSTIQYAFNEAVKGLVKKPWLLFHPEFVRNYPLIFRNIRRRVFGTASKIPAAAPTASNPPSVGIVGIGVLPTNQGKGTGQELMDAAQEESLKLGITRMHLTVKADNDRAIRAYKRHGWQTTEEDNIYNKMEKIIA